MATSRGSSRDCTIASCATCTAQRTPAVLRRRSFAGNSAASGSGTGVDTNGSRAGQHLAALVPALKAGAQKTDADEYRPASQYSQDKAAIVAAKSKNITQDASNRTGLILTQNLAVQGGSTRWQLSVPGTKSLRKA